MFTLDTKGLDTMHAKLLFLERFTQLRLAVDLNALDREENHAITNADVFQFLADGNSRSQNPQRRDLVTPTPEVIALMEQAFVDEVDGRIQAFGGMERWVTHKEILAGKGNRPPRTVTVKQRAQEAMGAALKAAAVVWEQFITDNIENSTWQGGGSDKLSDEYEDQKKREHGFAYPIGKATGQLLANVQPDLRNIKVVRGK